MLSTVLENVPSCAGWTNVMQHRQLFVARNFREFYIVAKFAKVFCSQNFTVLQ